MSACATCKSELPTGSRFCLNCGGKLSDPAADTVRLDAEEIDLLMQVVQRELSKDYDITRELGRGGMAVVYQAVEVELGRRVALKVLPPDMAMSRSMAERFKREARMSASLDHPNIIPIYRVGQAGSLFYIAMKLVEGRPLNEIVETQGALPMPVVIHLMRGAASALAYAHERGIVHRDVKCANILLDREGRAVVSDFGIARTVEDPAMTVPGLVIGTPYFMSPEQCAARRIGPQSDQYSLGIVLFQLLTGMVPFHADTLPGIMHHHFYTPVPDVTESRPDVPAGLAAVLARTLAKKPEERFATSTAMLAAVEAIPFSSEDRRQAEAMLKQLVLGAPIEKIAASTLPPRPPTATPRGTPIIGAAVRRRRPAFGIIAAAAVVAVAASVGTTLLTTRGNTQVAAADVGASPAIPQAATALPLTAVPQDTMAEAVRQAPPPRDDRRPDGRSRTDASREIPPAARTVEVTPARTVPAPPAATQAAPGLIRLRVYPVDADIMVDGKTLGRGVLVDTPMSAGVHRLRITAPGYEPHEAAFTVETGATLQMSSVSLQPVKAAP